jgi:hypothetical protein
MLDVKEAAQRASEYFAGLYSEQKISNVQLEEVEISDDGKYWLITLSYPVFPNELAPIQFLGKRKYKQFTIDAETGQVKSMKMRNVE